MSPIDAILKRATDIAVSVAVVATSWPLWIAIAVAIRADSPGSVFFRQQRLGRHGRPFMMWKFRTMVPDAESRGPTVTAKGDGRVTRVGRLLRRTKLDELPQFLNVLAGDMSLVGPRPEVPRYVRMFPDDFQFILQVRPGLTDEATLRYRNEEEILAAAPDPERHYVEVVLPDKIRMYRTYVTTASWRGDLSILARTLYRILVP